MTRIDAALYFIKGDLIGFFKAKPLGLSASGIFKECINHAQGSELDEMIGKCLSILRTSYLGYTETDVDYRCRGIAYAEQLDVAEADFGHFAKPYGIDYSAMMGGCRHNWKSYHGLFETDEYCTICNEKKAK